MANSIKEHIMTMITTIIILIISITNNSSSNNARSEEDLSSRRREPMRTREVNFWDVGCWTDCQTPLWHIEIRDRRPARLCLGVCIVLDDVKYVLGQLLQCIVPQTTQRKGDPCGPPKSQPREALPLGVVDAEYLEHQTSVLKHVLEGQQINIDIHYLNINNQH